MREGSVLCLDPHGFHRMRYTEWGDPRNPRVLVCVHGLTRNGRDFDYLAERLSDAYRVVCPDVAGRGRSDWLRDPKDYTYNLYCHDMVALLASLHADTVDWLGTSMGGTFGMLLASFPGSPIRKLVLNDIGSVIPKAALQRISQYVGKEPSFDTLEAFEAAMRSFSPFGELTAAQWRHLAVNVAKRGDDGRWRPCYDPGIAVNFNEGVTADVDLRSYWNALHGPVLVIRGAESDLLLPEILEEMQRRPRTEAFVVPRTGHPPMLMDDAQVGVVRRFLLT
ncbi:MAG TPA: alpha/beta hydrolase [Usitatibacter sp.]|nr:alpha/beta hydrolase [Usitatibacter sp.]